MSTVVCCIYCGRDTPNKCEVCSHCTKGIRKHRKPRGYTANDIRICREIHHLNGMDREDIDGRLLETAMLTQLGILDDYYD